ncbi:MAG: hypothetical protein WDN01_17990 [Rhizomicrobium sp.]
MIFRIVFGIFVVCLLVPHEPDIGFGRLAAERLLSIAAADLYGTLSTERAEMATARPDRPASATRAKI